MRGRVEAVRRHIEDRFNLGDQLDIRTKRVRTNNVFEVVSGLNKNHIFIFSLTQISVCGQLVHSRKRGDGLVDTAGKINTIMRSVEAIICDDA